ncbi:MAG: TRAM domain-containing protein [Spirochaetaceae bacterium]|nr:TRAM domain-containing protein [Spirochaetaceae bacterium]
MQIHEVEIEKIISNSCGLGRVNGKAVFVPYAIPGEKVTVTVTDEKNSYLCGNIKDILLVSPFRVVPACKYYYDCGGCTLGHIDYKMQLDIRKNLIKEAIERNGKIVSPEIEVVGGSPYSYRCRAQFHKSQDSTPGFKKRNSEEIIKIDFCNICNAGINNFLQSSPLLEKERVTVFAPDNNFSYDRNLTQNNVIEVKIKERIIKTDINCFFQSNIQMLEKTIDLIMKFAKGKVFFDLYSGVGVFALFLTEQAELVVSVESDKIAAAFAKENIKSSKAKFSSEKAEKFVLDWKGAIPDTVVLDPPRTGISIPVRKYLTDKKIKNIIYLSCDYATFGRDLGFFTEKKYLIKKLFFLDFYPQTAHAESLAVLEFMG